MSNNHTPVITIAGADASVLVETDLMQLTCGTRGCDSTCCKASAPIVLNPYEIALVCRESDMSYEDLLDVVDTERANGFPLVMLPRDPVCHFWTENGCRIYKARPLACRLFPIGRVYNDMQSRFVLPGQNLCDGLATEPAGTVDDYLKTQDAALQIRMADRWIDFVNEIEKLPLPDKPVTSVAFHLFVYSPDTPPAPSSGIADALTSPEERFILRLETALAQLPRFLCRS
ncbi:MAG: YkgJ family cysteine cluster protein [Nitrospirae bacterium]|nr:YkgJ family cysteine cluster protein [Nitrospirota bacterium]